jgi:hypothetical protein
MQNELIGAFKQKGVVQDSVHGFIPINEAEYWLLQTAFLRRLHNIKQLGMAFLVFPSARHSRLEHSLGVMHIASYMSSKVIAELRHNPTLCSELLEYCDEKHMNVVVQVARLTGLLHDVGHLAYSHMSESAIEYMAKYDEREGASSLYQELARLSRGTLKVHEAYGLAFIEAIKKLAESSHDMQQLKPYLDVVEGLLNPMGPSSTGSTKELGLKSESLSLIHDMISNEIADADRLDYLQRDAQATGIVYGNIDLDRLIEGLKVSITDNGHVILSLDIKSLQTLEDIFDARYKMYRSVYFHHKIMAISKSVSRFIREIPRAKLTLPMYLDDFRDAISPSSLAKAILDDAYYFDDPELDIIARLAAGGSDELSKRWALSLMERRDLLPVSLVKRSEELVMLAINKLREHGVEPMPAALSQMLNFIGNKVSDLQEGLRKELKEPDIVVDHFEGTIVNTETLRSSSVKMFNWDESSYLRALFDQSSIPVVLLYAYSDNIKDHITLRSKAAELREIARRQIAGVLEEGFRYLRT